jgi:DNA-binding NtrC family response regulator
MLPIENLQLKDIEEICIIDDDSMSLFLAEKIFEYEIPDVPVKAFLNVDDCLIYLTNHKGTKRLILVDLNMPMKDGWCFLETYEGNKATDLIFILSSSDNILDKTKAKNFSHLADYLEKPISIEMVIGLIRRY